MQVRGDVHPITTAVDTPPDSVGTLVIMVRTIALLMIAAAASLGCNGGVDVPDCGGDETDDTCEVFRLVNDERIEAGVDPYEWNTELAVAAELHAQDMVDQGYFDHTSLDGRSFSERAGEAGYDASPRGENIAAGQPTPDAVMSSWMNSDGHRRNILADGSNEIGIGLVELHWVQVFGHRAEEG